MLIEILVGCDPRGMRPSWDALFQMCHTRAVTQTCRLVGELRGRFSSLAEGLDAMGSEAGTDEVAAMIASGMPQGEAAAPAKQSLHPRRSPFRILRISIRPPYQCTITVGGSPFEYMGTPECHASLQSAM